MKTRSTRLLVGILAMTMILTILSGCSSTEAENDTGDASAAETSEANLSEEGKAEDTDAGTAEEESGSILSVTSISHIFGDGSKVSSVAVEYGEVIDPASLTTESFEVKNRTVIDVHTNREAAETDENIEGNYVILDLEVQSPLLDDSYASDGRIEGMTVIYDATVVQLQDIQTADGTVIPASDEEVATDAGDGGIMGNAATQTPETDMWEGDHYFNDPDTNAILIYNLFTPEGYEDSGEEYPLVLFIPDASAVACDWEYVIEQGNGATCWTTDEWQAENPCFVVSMVFEDKYINDYNEYYETYMTGTINLIKYLKDAYPVDDNRIYATGQSMGCMASMIMMEREPDLFAGAYIVAGQWDPEEIKDIKDQNILLLVSEDDNSAMQAERNVEKWIEEGGAVVTGSFDGIADQETRETVISEFLAQDANIYFLKINSGTGSMDGDGNALNGSHRMTFRIAYDLPCVMEWLFEQTKAG